MCDNNRYPVGALVMDPLPPAQIFPFARLTEELGFGELWVPEDCFFNSGIATAAICLGATQEIPVGIGLAPAVVRHPALLAMEIATLAGAFPGRLMPAIGLGTPMILKQMGIYPPSPLTAMRECLTVVRQLLSGEKVTLEGRTFHLSEIQLVHPPGDSLPLYCGAMGPKMTQLAGELADGNIIGISSTPDIVRLSLEQMAQGARATGREFKPRCPVFVLYAVGKDRASVKQYMRSVLAFLLSVFPRNPYTEQYGCADDVERILAKGGPPALVEEMPESWVDDLAIAGEPDECAERIDQYLDAGAASVIIAPQPADAYAEMLRMTAEEVFPRMKTGSEEGAKKP